MTQNKVYIVKTYQGSYDDSWWNIHCIRHDAHEAEVEKRKLEKKIESIKAEYENEFGSNYDSDFETKMELPKEKRWEQVYLYQAKHVELKYHTIVVNEHEVL